MKRVRRRDFLRFGLGLSTLGFSGLRTVFAAVSKGTEDLNAEVFFTYMENRARRDEASLKRAQQKLESTLSAYLETLIPRDATSSALELGGLGNLLRETEADRQLKKLVSLGCIWLDIHSRKKHGRTFAELESAAREQVVARMAGANERRIEQRFFQKTRKIAFRHYYSQPGVWSSLGYAGPPQPRGFPDFTRAPGS